jgi:hypothetical protein
VLLDQAEAVIADLPPEHRAAARVLQDTLIEMVGDGDEDDDGDEADDGAANTQPCEPCEPAPEATEQERVAAAYFALVREACAWTDMGPLPSPSLAVLNASYNGCAGALLLTSGQLLWVAVGAHFSEAGGLRFPLSTIERHTASLIKSPFGNSAAFVVTPSDKQPRAFVRFECGSALEAVEMFSLEVATAIAAIPRPAGTSDAGASGASGAAAVPARRQTKQVLAAVDMRQKLKQVVGLQRSHKAGSTEAAAAVLSGLAADEGKTPSKHTIYKESEHLRDVALGFGGFTLSKRVIEQFLKMPSVKLLLPDALREQQDAASDAVVAKELMAAAKEFFTDIFGVGFRGGRLSDEDRNVYAGAMAALLPRDLFAKRGRAASASRLTGLGYRQMHRGCDQRAELEDRACGWRRIRTAEHQDKVNYGPLKEFWHSDLASTPDNPAPADFPEARQRLDIFDGCPNQFAYGDNFHQIAVWRAKTARWAKHRLAEASATAAAAGSTAALAASAASAAATRAAAAVHDSWMRAAAHGTPNAAFNVGAATTIHHLSREAATAISTLVTSAHTTSAATRSASVASVLTATAASAAATSAAATHRLAGVAAEAAAAAAEAATSTAVSSQQTELASARSTAALALAAAATATVAATAASDAISGVPTSLSAAAAIAASPSLDGIVRMAIKLVEHHGKSGCDGNSNTPVLALKNAIVHGQMGPNPGTRELAIFLALFKASTSTPKASKRGWEAITRIFYGYLNTDRFTKSVVPDANGSKFLESKKHSSFVGRHPNAQVFKDGELQACHEFCPCSECLLGRYTSCTLMPEMGRMHRVVVPWLSGPPLRQLEELVAWGDMLKTGMIVAFTADVADVHLEGIYWLALIKGPAYPVPESQVHSNPTKPYPYP